MYDEVPTFTGVKLFESIEAHEIIFIVGFLDGFFVNFFFRFVFVFSSLNF